MKIGDQVKIKYRYGKKGQQRLNIEFGDYKGLVKDGIFKNKHHFYLDDSSHLYLSDKDIIEVKVI